MNSKTRGIPFPSIECSNFNAGGGNDNKPLCPINVLLVLEAEQLSQQIVACGTYCHLVILHQEKSNKPTYAYHTACCRVTSFLDQIFKDAQSIIVPEEALSTRRGEHTMAAIHRRSAIIPDQNDFATPEQVLRYMLQRGEEFNIPLTHVDETGRQVVVYT